LSEPNETNLPRDDERGPEEGPSESEQNSHAPIDQSAASHPQSGMPQPPAPPPPPQQPIIPDQPPSPVGPEQPNSTQFSVPIANQLQRAEQEIAQIERNIGGKRKLTEDEKEIIYAKYLGEQMSVIDRHTAELYKKYEDTKIVKSTRLKRFLTALGKITGASVGGFVIRTLLKTTPVGTVAGTITGAVIGGIMGGWRGVEAATSRHFGTEGWLAEYQQIKNQERDPYARENALKFLEHVLSNPKNFKGSHSDLLKMLAYYRREATQLYIDANPDNVGPAESEPLSSRIMRIGEQRIKIDNETIERFFNNLGGNANVAEFITSHANQFDRRAKISAFFGGAWKGALIGGGVGAVSDLISHYLSGLQHARAEHAGRIAHDQYLAQNSPGTHYDYLNRQYAPTAAEANYPLPPDQLYQHGLSTVPTDYGNALKHAIYSNAIKPPEGVSDAQFRDFLRILNFVRPTIPEHINVPVQDLNLGVQGGHFQFDHNSLQEFVNNALSGGKINFDLISHADEFLSGWQGAVEQAAKMTADIAATQAGQATMAEAAAEAIAGAAPGIGGAIGAIAAARNKESKVDIASVNLPGKAKAETTGSPVKKIPPTKGGPTEKENQESPEPQPQDEPAAETPPATPPPPQQHQEKRPPAENQGRINWEEILREGQEVLQNRANEVLRILGDKPWGELDESERENLISLFRFFNETRDRKIFIKIFIYDAIGIGEYMGANLDDPNKKLIIEIKRPAHEEKPTSIEKINLADGEKHILSCEIKKNSAGEYKKQE